MKLIILSTLLSIATLSASAQYYYNDIISTQQTDKQYAVLKENKIHHVSAVSFENDNTQTEGFSLHQYINADAQKITTHINNIATGNTSSVSYYANNKIVRNEDSSAKVLTVTIYKYDEQNRIESLLSTTTDTSRNNSFEEFHHTYK